MSALVSETDSPAPPHDLASRVLYRDNLLLVLDKPSGLAVHPGPSGGDHLESYLAALRFGYKEIPAPVHRLDRDTAGCLALGRNRRALRRLGRLFERRLVEKTYWAVVAGRPADDAGTVDLPLAKRSDRRDGWRMVVDPTGRAAATDYRLRGRGDGLAWLELRPRTGRTHQVRVHCAALGCPILGDPVYGSGGPRLHLLARALVLPLHDNRPPISVVAPTPDHMAVALAACAGDAGVHRS